MKREILILTFGLAIAYSCNQTANQAAGDNIDFQNIHSYNINEQYDFGRKLLEQDKSVEAIKVFSYLIKHNNPTVVFHTSRAMAYSDIAKHDSAIADMDIAVGLHNDASIINLRGQLKHEAKLFTQAIIDFDSVIAKQSNFDQAYIGKGLSLLELDRQREACECFNLGLAFRNKDAKTLIEQYCK